MVTLLQALKERDMSVYKLVKVMELGASNYTHFLNKVKGRVSMRSEELDRICEVISEASGKELKASEIDFRPVWVKLVE